MSAAAAPSSTTNLVVLMRAMGSPNGAFDPMPPPQHKFFLDRSQPMVNRAIAWVWSKTIHPGKGHKHSPFARDERGVLTLTHAATDLGWSLANASTTFKKLEDEGRIRRDEKGRIFLRADVPEPEQTKGEDGVEALSAQKLPARLVALFQQLPKSEAKKATVAYFKRQEHWQRVAADAIALVRRAEDEDEKAWLATMGLTLPVAPKGRPILKREARLVEIKIVAPDSSVHKTTDDGESTSVQNDEAIVYASGNGSEHKSASLLPLRSEDSKKASSLSESSKRSSETTGDVGAQARAVEIEDETYARLKRAGLDTVGNAGLDAQTVQNMRRVLESLNDQQVKEVLDVLEDKARKLAHNKREAQSITWGWLVGLVRGETKTRLDRVSPVESVVDIHAKVKTAAAGKRIP